MRHDRESCPCKRIKCPRHGDCAACKEYHKNSRYRTACEQRAQKELKGNCADPVRFVNE